MLEKRGHTVTVARNGREALEVLKNREFDVVLMDVQMPEMDGFEATTIIRNQERQSGKHIPIVAMTAHAMKGDLSFVESPSRFFQSPPLSVNARFTWRAFSI